MIVAASQIGGQAVTGLVRDSASQRPLFGASVAILSAQGASVTTGTANALGRFHLTLPLPGSYSIEAHLPGYVATRLPLGPYPRDASAIGDSLDGTIELAAVPGIDLGHIIDSLARRLFIDSPGRVQFESHMGLGKGHFIAGGDLQRSGLPLSELSSPLLDSMTLVPKPDPNTPVVPASYISCFSPTTTSHHCLNVRVDRASLPEVMLQRRSDNIDDLLPPTEITGIELYLSPAEVPPDLRPDAFPDKTDVVARPGYGPYSMGVVGTYDLLVQRGVRLERPPLLPSCPFMQIWTRAAW